MLEEKQKRKAFIRNQFDFSLRRLPEQKIQV